MLHWCALGTERSARPSSRRQNPAPSWRGAALALAWACTCVVPCARGVEPSVVAVGQRGMVATVDERGTQAGLGALEQGGNAVDAAIAAALMLGVTDGQNSGIGGGTLILIRRADGRIVAIDGRETAPARATRDMFLVAGRPDPKLSRTGPLAVGVPGALAAYAQAVRDYGRLPLAQLLEPAAAVADEGFVIDASYAANIRREASDLRRFDGSRAVLLGPDGQPLAAGNVLRQPDLARTYRAIARSGPEWFYRGPLADQVAAWMRDHGGILTVEDLAQYQPVLRQPIESTYRGYRIIGFPPPSSGGMHVAEILNILEHFDLAALNKEDPALMLHVVAEAMKPAFADRAYWLGDSDFVRVPRGLVAKSYAAELAAHIRLDHTTPVTEHGRPPAWETDVVQRHTTHVAAADAEGNWVALTTTVNTTFGSKIIVPGTGVVLNNQMDDFSVHPGVPNAFGLVGADANCVAPGKRPLSSMSPTLVLDGDHPVMTLGAAGGPTIITQVVLTLVRHLDLEMPLDAALAAPRIHHQWSPDTLYVEPSMPQEWIAGLAKRGHHVEVRKEAGACQAISVLRSNGTFVGAAEPRVHGVAKGR